MRDGALAWVRADMIGGTAGGGSDVRVEGSRRILWGEEIERRPRRPRMLVKWTAGAAGDVGVSGFYASWGDVYTRAGVAGAELRATVRQRGGR